MSEIRVSSRYAKALLDLAESENKVADVKKDFDIIQEIITNSREVSNLINSPIIQFMKKRKIAEEIFKPYITTFSLNFLLLLIEKRRETIIPDIVKQFHIKFNEAHGILPVDVVSAVEMDEKLKGETIQALKQRTGKQIQANFKVDPSIKGGVKLRIKDWVYDSSIERQLMIIHDRLSKGLSLNEESIS